MTNRYRTLALAALFGGSLLGTATADSDRAYVETDLVVNKQVDGVPTLTDSNGIVHHATFFDPNLFNPWGLGESATSPFWVADNGASVSTLYNTAGQPLPLVVSIPAPGDPLGASGAPTGLVFNIGFDDGAFPISGVDAGGHPITAPARFLFATEDGTILGWNPNVNPAGANPATFGTHAIIAVDNSAAGAIYKGLAIARDTISGGFFLYATDFHNRRIDAFTGPFATVSFPPTPSAILACPATTRRSTSFPSSSTDRPGCSYPMRFPTWRERTTWRDRASGTWTPSTGRATCSTGSRGTGSSTLPGASRSRRRASESSEATS